MTNMPLENRQVERVLSVLVILYGLWLLIPNLESLIRFVPPDSRDSSISPILLAFALLQIVAGCLLLCCFPFVVKWISYFATERTARSQRQWFAPELCAIPLVCFASMELVSLVVSSINLLTAFIFFDISVTGLELLAVICRIAMTCMLIVLAGIVVIIFLFNAHRLAAWLLRRVNC